MLPSFHAARLDYDLPAELVAQEPSAERGGSRLLHVRVDPAAANGGSFADRQFVELPELLPPRTLVVLNDSGVIPARLHGRRASGGAVELLYLEHLGEGVIRAIVGSNAKLAVGEVAALPGGWHAELLEPKALDGVAVQLRAADGAAPSLEDTLEYLRAYGETPLPPYIRRDAAATADRERYQTVYAAAEGSVAAPTAGLHFIDSMLARLRSDGHSLRHVTLHVGAGTFAPLRVDNLRDHEMHAEAYSVEAEVAAEYAAAQADGTPILAVGTTSLRILHTLSCGGTGAPASGNYSGQEITGEGVRATNIEGDMGGGKLRPYGNLTGTTAAFIYPGHGTDAADLLLTNFHLPRSTLLALVYAFGGEELMLSVYAHAVAQRYRFFSYGDCMLIDRRGAGARPTTDATANRT